MTEKLWVQHYDANVPEHLDYPEIAIQDFLYLQAKKDPKRTALICEGKSINYAELFTLSQAFAHTLIVKGLQRGERVGICLPNSIEFVISYFGTLMAGGIVAAMNPNYPLPEWQYQTAIAKPAILIGSKNREADFRSLCHSSACKNLIQVGNSSNSISDLDFVEVEPNEGHEDHLLPDVHDDFPALLQFSGGTTGVPKAALALHKNVVANIIQFKQWLTPLKEGQEVFLTVIPLYHVYGMVIGLNVGIAMGATIVLVPDGRDLENVLNLIPKYGVTFFPGVPSLYNAINHNPKALARQINLRSIKACISGSAPLLEETRVQFETLTGGKLVEGYGLSEAPTATHCNPIQGENRNGSIGLPLPDVDCKIVDPENETIELHVGEAGELLIRSPQLMQGYYQSPKETQIALKEGWLHTGDIAKMDKDGYFYIVGRIKELIKVNGLQVWPIEVENVLMRFPGVREAAVAGIPDDESGEAVKAWIILEQEENFNVEDLISHCRKLLAGYKIPKEVEFVRTIPKSPVGKILKRELIRMDIEQKKKSGA